MLKQEQDQDPCAEGYSTNTYQVTWFKNSSSLLACRIMLPSKISVISITSAKEAPWKIKNKKDYLLRPKKKESSKIIFFL